MFFQRLSLHFFPVQWRCGKTAAVDEVMTGKQRRGFETCLKALLNSIRTWVISSEGKAAE